MNKTLYIKDEDAQIWDRARELAGDKLSPIIVTGLKKFIAEKEAEQAEAVGFQRLLISYNDAENHNIPTKKAFMGKWIFPPDSPFQSSTEDGYHTDSYALALTAKCNVAVLAWEENNESLWNYRFYVFPSLEAAAANSETNWVARSAIKEIGIQVEELDI